MDNFEKRRKAFLDTIRGGQQSAINKKRTEEAREFHKKFHTEMKENEIIIQGEIGTKILTGMTSIKPIFKDIEK